MSDIDKFFHHRNIAKNVSDNEITKTHSYLESIKAFARTTYKSIYVIDYLEKGFEYVSENPLFLCGLSASQVKQMGYAFYFEHVVAEDMDLLLRINTIGFDFYENLALNERKRHTISYDFRLKNEYGKSILINQKLTPLFLTNEGKIWKALCIISLSNESTSGNIKIYRKGDRKVFSYDLEGSFWRTNDKIELTEREKEILRLSIRGYTIKDIAEKIFVSPDTVKFHRKKLFQKLEVSNISEAIVCATNNKLI